MITEVINAAYVRYSIQHYTVHSLGSSLLLYTYIYIIDRCVTYLCPTTLTVSCLMFFARTLAADSKPSYTVAQPEIGNTENTSKFARF